MKSYLSLLPAAHPRGRRVHPGHHERNADHDGVGARAAAHDRHAGRQQQRPHRRPHRAAAHHRRVLRPQRHPVNASDLLYEVATLAVNLHLAGCAVNESMLLLNHSAMYIFKAIHAQRVQGYDLVVSDLYLPLYNLYLEGAREARAAEGAHLQPGRRRQGPRRRRV